LGVTPSAWSTITALQVKNAFVGGLTNNAYFGANAYYNGTNYIYQASSFASLYFQSSSAHQWFTAPSGTAGNAITFTQAMTLDASGNLGLGTTSPTFAAGTGLQVKGAGFTSVRVTGGSLTGTDLSQDASGGYLYVRDNLPLMFGTNNTERARIDSSGNFIVGNTTAYGIINGYTAQGGTQLSVLHGSAGSYPKVSGISFGQPATSISVSNNGGTTTFTGGAGIYANNTASSGNPTSLVFWVNASGSPAEAARIDSSGNLLVGTTNSSPSAGVGVKTQPSGKVYCVSADSTNASESYGMYSTGAANYRFYVGWGGTVYATSTTITAISDQRLKENVRDLDDGLDVVMALKPRKFDWKEGKGANIKNARGFIAQEFETVLPDMIETWRDPAPEGEEPYKAINANLIPTLVKAIQEQQAIIESLKARLDAANL
jgi:hypothetical protein